MRVQLTRHSSLNEEEPSTSDVFRVRFSFLRVVVLRSPFPGLRLIECLSNRARCTTINATRPGLASVLVDNRLEE